jgi:hypothetical protein
MHVSSKYFFCVKIEGHEKLRSTIDSDKTKDRRRELAMLN